MAQAITDRVDIAIAGAGIVGLAVGLAVRQAAPAGTRVLLCDPGIAASAEPARTFRAVAIAARSRRFLDRLGVWDVIAPMAQPMTAMVLADGRPGAQPPPVYLDFAGDVAPGEPFAHMVFLDDLRGALLEACGRSGVLMRASAVGRFIERPHGLVLDPGSPDEVPTRLLVAADGGRSRLREQAGIRTVGWDYGQSAIVATLAHERDHKGRAAQQFLPGGPLAMLPMRADDGSARRSSLVWTERRGAADRLLALPAESFLDALRERIGYGYGPLRLEDRPSGHSLRMSLARSLVGTRLALVGDAARTIHPLAGQGLNLGLSDAAALAAGVTHALDLGLDPGSPGVLAEYQRARRADSTAMAATTDMLNRLFSNDRAPLRLLRDLGLGLVDRAPALKRLLIREASGTAAAPAGRRERPPRRAGR